MALRHWIDTTPTVWSNPPITLKRRHDASTMRGGKLASRLARHAWLVYRIAFFPLMMKIAITKYAVCILARICRCRHVELLTVYRPVNLV
jgi:hypothetical protein